jgi:hypothetical protein
MPAYGFFIRHVKNIELNNVEISYLGKETRPAFILDDVKGIQLFRSRAQAVPNVKTFVLKNVENFSIEKSEGIKDQVIKKSVSSSL